MEFLLLLVLLDTPEHITILHTSPLQQRHKVFGIEVTIWTAVRLPRPGMAVRKDFLAAERRIAVSTAVRVSSNITVRVTHIVTVFLVECIIGDLAEACTPEVKAVFER